MEALRASVLTVTAQRNREAIKRRKESWDMLKTEHPEIADFMSEINRVFGKPKMVIVKVDDQTVFDSRVCNKT